MDKIVIAIAGVKLVTDVMKNFIPQLKGRYTQFIVLGLSIIGAVYATGITDIPVLISAVGAIFSGALAADQILKKKV